MPPAAAAFGGVSAETPADPVRKSGSFLRAALFLSKFLFDEVAAASVVRIDDQASDHDSFAVDITFGE